MNEGQEKAIEEGLRWYRYRHKQTFEVNGYAGTGKTTMIFEFIRRLGLSMEEVLFIAYVGKATLAMRRRGVSARTIHSTIYKLQEVTKRDENGNIVKEHGRAVMVLRFVPVESLPPQIRLIVIDEAGMVPDSMAKQILSYGIPVVALGDLAQLPPIMGRSFFLRAPDASLTEIMRQEADDPILRLATMARKGESIPYGKYGDQCFVIPKEKLSDRMLIEHDIIICGTNKTRDSINHYYREKINGYVGDVPKVGEKLICRKNNWAKMIEDYSLINGMMGEVTYVHKERCNTRSYMIDFHPEFLEAYQQFEKLTIDRNFLITPVQQKTKADGLSTAMDFRMDRFEYGYAITCHLAQGSEYDKVLIYDDKRGMGFDYKRWLYTAITRAKSQLLIVK